MFGLTILGNNSAIPAFGRHPTSQALTFENQVYLIDCGEGTQMQIQRYKVRRSKINHIFISHLHGDHYFGLIGLIISMELMGREAPLHIYGPAKLEDIIQLQLNAAGTRLRFPLHFKPNEKAGVIATGSKMEVSCFQVSHRIECWGYLFREKKLPRKLIKDAAIASGIPANFFYRLQSGEDYTTKTGKRIPNEKVTTPNLPGRSYAYCADTIYDESLCDIIEKVDLLYHEATYLHEWVQRAGERFHSTAQQAGVIASKAGVKKLLIGHFGSKYESLELFQEEVKETFENAELALEGITFRILQSYS